MASSPDVPGRLPVAIETHAYQIEPTGFERVTVQVLRQQADQSSEPGEASLNPQGLWRRSQESWHHGAGQAFLDGKDEQAADPHRFRSSKGVDIWTRGQISLLHPTMNIWSTTGSNLYLAVTQDSSGLFFLLNIADGNELYGAALPYTLLNTIALQQGTGWTITNGTVSVLADWFRVTSTSAAVVSLISPTGTSGFPVDPGRQYGFSFLSNNISGTGGGRVPNIAIRWYTAAGATISTTTAVPAPGSDGSQAVAFSTANAPSNAATGAVILSWTAAWDSGDVHQVRAVSMGPYDDVSTLGYPDTWTAAGIQAGQPAQPIKSLATDGSYVWAALGTSGLHRSLLLNATADTPAAPGSGQIGLVGYANGFLLAAGSSSSVTEQNVLWVVLDPLGTPTLSAIKTHPNPAFAWTGIAPGRSCVYAFGNSGGNGEVYKITFDPNTGSLATAASSATYLPDGETIHALQFYAGGIIMGTGRGVRLGQADGAGNIDYGPLVPTSWPVRCLEPQDRYCWFGWTKYDATTSGLGRVDLGFFTDSLTPAWASDLMAAGTTQGDVVSAVTFAPYGYTANQRPPVRVFTVAGKGVYIEDPGSRVASGQLSSGTIRFSTSEPKITRSVDVRHHALPAGGGVTVEMQRDTSGTWESLGSSTTTGSYGPTTPLDALSETAEALEFRFTLARPTPNGTDYSQTVEVTRWTSKVLATPSTIDETFTIPIQMRHEVVDMNDSNYSYPSGVAVEISYLKGLERSRALVNLQMGTEQATVYILGSQFKAANWSPDRKYLEGTYTIQAMTVRG